MGGYALKEEEKEGKEEEKNRAEGGIPKKSVVRNGSVEEAYHRCADRNVAFALQIGGCKPVSVRKVESNTEYS